MWEGSPQDVSAVMAAVVLGAAAVISIDILLALMHELPSSCSTAAGYYFAGWVIVL